MKGHDGQQPDKELTMDEQVANTLKSIAANPCGDAVARLKENGCRCATCLGHIEGIKALRTAAAGCSTICDYAAFLNDKLPVQVEADGNSIVIHLGKPHCTCPVARELKDGILCNCTVGHEEAMWSVFFGCEVKAEIIESHLRGGKDCVVRIVVKDV